MPTGGWRISQKRGRFDPKICKGSGVFVLEESKQAASHPTSPPSFFPEENALEANVLSKGLCAGSG